MKKHINRIIVLSLIFTMGLCACGEEEAYYVTSHSQQLDTNEALPQSNEVYEEQPAKEQSEYEPLEEAVSDTVTVYVCGAVKEPGVYELCEGSRVIQATDMAGGFLENAATEYVNLATLLTDGQRVYIPTVDEVLEDAIPQEYAETAAKEQTSGSASDGRIDLNHATKEELMTLPGIGEAKAENIISYRETAGGFQKPEDVMQIPGIKEGLFEKIKDKIITR